MARTRLVNARLDGSRIVTNRKNEARFAFESDQFVAVNPDSATDTTELLSRIDPTLFHCLEVSATLEVAGATEAPSIASAKDLRAFHDDGVTSTSGAASDPGNDAIALNEGPADAPDDLVDDASGGRARLLWRRPRRPVACQRSSLVLLLMLFACRPESPRVERTATAAASNAIAVGNSGLDSTNTRPPDPPARRKTKRVFQAVVGTGSDRVAETCAELDTGEIVCSLNGDHGCSLERLASGVQRVGQSLCAVSGTGLPVSLEGVGCELQAGSNRLVERAFDNDDAACVRERDGTVYCTEKPKKARRRMLSRVQELAFGTSFFCGLRDNGEVWCWGRNEQGGLGDGRSHISTVAVRVRLPEPARSLAIGNQHACTVLGDDSVRCWGENTQGAVGVGRLPSAGDIPIPDSPNEYLTLQKVVGLPPVNSVMAAGNQTCALTLAGEIFCWGETWSETPGQTAFVPSATLVSGLPRAVALTLGRPTCAVTVDGQAFCWGEGCPLSAPGAKPRAVGWTSSP